MMDEALQRQADRIASHADLWHELEGATALARVVARHYRALVACGMPEDLAGELTIQYQAMRLTRGTLGVAADEED